MKNLLILLAIVFLFTGTAFADFLACSIPTENQNIVGSEVELDGVARVGIWQVSQDGTDMLLLDLAGIGSGQHTFRARVKDTSGWWSDWSDPLDAGKPASLGNVKVVER